ncbi:MAG: hypothetical protein AB7O50_09355 [Pseudolabrys sp.]
MNVSPEALKVARMRIGIEDEKTSFLVHRRILLDRKRINWRFFTQRDAEMLAFVESRIRLCEFRLYLLGGPPLHRKAGFDPNQPRVPAGNSDGGQWTDGSNAGGPLKITIHPRRGEDDGLPLSPAPQVPDVEPATRQLFNAFLKEAARWLAKAAVREVAAGPVIGTFLNALEVAEWGYRTYPYIRAYLDEPKTLAELKEAASIQKTARNPGYEIHHVVEQEEARKAGFPKSLIETSDNKVRIPKLKHWEITGWYMTKNENFGGLSPREYLRDKDWAERRRVGLLALVEKGVLKP